MEEQSNKLNLKEIMARIKATKMVYVKVLGIILVLSALWIFPQPRYYKSTVSLAPESADESSLSAVSSIASSFGVNLGGMTSADAFYPLLYPDIVESNDFVVGLFDVKVKTLDGKINTTYYDYLEKHQKVSFWDVPFIALRRFIKKIFPGDASLNGRPGEAANPFRLSMKQDAIMQTICGNITCSVDKKTDVITLTVTDQDRLICATMADSVRVHLQQYITNYRTSKSRNDVAYYEKLVEESRVDYEKASARYASYADSHQNAILARVSEKMTQLENDLQAKYSAYSAFQTQLQASKAKVQEHTPAFTVLKRASVPLLPAGPKRVLFCMCMLVLGFLGTTIYQLRREIFGL